jgi:two-component system cell cycle sensor histidine kinase/response regulator CckA
MEGRSQSSRHDGCRRAWFFIVGYEAQDSLFSSQALEIYTIEERDIGNDFFKIASRIPQDDSLEVATLALQAGKKIREKKVTISNGKVYLRRVFPYRAKDGEMLGVLLSFTEISQLDHTETAARLNAERLKIATETAKVGINRDITEQLSGFKRDALLTAIVENSIDGILTKDLNGRITSWNAGATKILQYSKEEIIGKNVRELIPDSRRGEEDSIVNIIQSGKSLTNYHTQRLCKNGAVTEVSISVFPIHTRDGKIESIASIIRDTTDTRRIERKLQEADKFESLGVLAGGIAHEFNNLLTGILANVGMAQREIQACPQAAESLGEIRASARQAADLCLQMLTYAGKTDYEFVAVELCDLARDVVKFLGRSIHRNIQIELTNDDGKHVVMGDAVKIRQILVDLMLNAAESIGSSGGKITIKLKEETLKEDEIGELRLGYRLKPGIYASVSISDNGCGMTPKQLEHIFDPFFSTKFTGRGLGLPTVRGILTAHHGALKVQSESGVGTTFTVLLPHQATSEKKVSMIPTPKPHPGKAQSKEAIHPSSLPGKGKVLVIDDLVMIRRALKRLLGKLGFDEVLVAEDGETGFELYKEHAKDLRIVFLDLVMPGWDGAATFGALHAYDPDIPVVVMSGYVEEQVEESFKGGELPAGFLQKPFDEDLVKSCLELARQP